VRIVARWPRWRGGIPATIFKRGTVVTTLIDMLIDVIRGKAGDAPVASNAESDATAAALTPEERKAAVAGLNRLDAETETMGVKLARDVEQASATRIAKDRDAEEARKAEDHAKTLHAAHGWTVECRKSRLMAILKRGANPLIDRVIGMLEQQWQDARLIARVVGTRFSPLTEADIASNQAADANLQGYRTAIAEMEDLKFAEDQSDQAIVSAAELIIRKIPSRHPNHEPIAIELLPKNGSARPRVAHGARAVA
jgi:hypothetical protein